MEGRKFRIIQNSLLHRRSEKTNYTFGYLFQNARIIQWFAATWGACSQEKWLNHIQEQYYEPNICFLPKFLCWIMNLQDDAIMRQGNWEVMRWMKLRRWGPHDGIIVFIRRDTREHFLSLPCEIQQELAIWKSRGEPSPGTDSVRTLILNQSHNCEK